MKVDIQKSYNNEDTLVIDEAIRFFYGNLTDVSKLQLLFPIVIAFLFQGAVDQLVLIIWLVLSVMIYVGRIFLAKQYEKKSPPPEKAHLWGLYFTYTALASGLLWGYAAFTFHDPAQIYHEVMLYVLVIGTATGSLMLTAYWLPGFYANAIPAIGGVILNLFIHENTDGKYLGFLFILFLFMLFKVAKGSNKAAYDTIRLRFENKELIQRLEQEKEKAETASRAKTRFLASANHDLRQPVHALSLLIYSLQKELTTSHGKLLFLRLERSITNLSNLLESLLDLSRLDAETIKVKKTNVSVTSITSQMLSEFLPIAREKGLHFSVHSNDYFIYTDKTLLDRLLRNLLNNAFSYTKEGGVLLGFRKRGQDMMIEVWDTGIGIPEQEKEKIFNEFYQIENAERNRSKGLGLGLSICQSISKLLGSEINFESRQRRGSVFRFRLPLTDPTAIDITTVSDPQPMNDLAGKTLLIIDDDIEVLTSMITLLSAWNITPLSATNYYEATQLLKAYPGKTDAIICDHRLSNGMSGMDIIEKLQKQLKIPALLITGDTSPDLIQTLEKSEQTILYKPVTPDRLYFEIGKLFSL